MLLQGRLLPKRLCGRQAAPWLRATQLLPPGFVHSSVLHLCYRVLLLADTKIGKKLREGFMLLNCEAQFPIATFFSTGSHIFRIIVRRGILKDSLESSIVMEYRSAHLESESFCTG